MDWVFVIGLIIMGFFLLLVEIFIIPGITLAGIVGSLSIAGGIYYAYAKIGAWPAVGALVLSLVIGGIFLAFVIRTKSWGRLILSSREESKAGFRSSKAELEKLVGRVGRSLTPLRPAGTALIGEEKVDVVTEGDFIERDTQITVVEVQGNRVIVRPS